MLVAVYGSLLKGLHNHSVIARVGEYKYTAMTKPSYTMYSLGSFPALREEGNTSVIVEVYEVKDISPIDRLEGHPHFYKREEVTLMNGEKAWMYLYTKEMLDTTRLVISSGNWKEYMKSFNNI
jgi:gamma-glutamylaminecyclotransferase